MSNNDSTEEKDGKREKRGFRLPDAPLPPAGRAARTVSARAAGSRTSTYGTPTGPWRSSSGTRDRASRRRNANASSRRSIVDRRARRHRGAGWVSRSRRPSWSHTGGVSGSRTTRREGAWWRSRSPAKVSRREPGAGGRGPGLWPQAHRRPVRRFQGSGGRYRFPSAVSDAGLRASPARRRLWRACGDGRRRGD